MSPSAGKESLMEERLRRASGVMAKDAAASRIFKIEVELELEIIF